jgi:hypothetical protein
MKVDILRVKYYCEPISTQSCLKQLTVFALLEVHVRALRNSENLVLFPFKLVRTLSQLLIELIKYKLI